MSDAPVTRVRTPGEAKKLRKKILLSILFGVVGIVLVYNVVSITWTYYLEPYLSQKKAYESAQVAISEGDIPSAIEYLADSEEQGVFVNFFSGVKFGGIGSYKDSSELRFGLSLDLLKQSKVGDYVYWGQYEQDYDFGNGPEAIKWLVLEAEGSERLLICDSCIDCRPMNYDQMAVTWETSYMRSWLNSGFYKSVFSLEERQKIIKSELHTDPNAKLGTSGGGDTQDYVYLLSAEESIKYFPTDGERMAQPTKYARAWGANYRENSWWWLRTTGEDDIHFAIVLSDGTINYDGFISRMNSDATIRPVIRVDVDRKDG